MTGPKVNHTGHIKHPKTQYACRCGKCPQRLCCQPKAHCTSCAQRLLTDEQRSTPAHGPAEKP